MSSPRDNTRFLTIVFLGLAISLLTDAAPNLSKKSFNDGDFNPIISLLCPTNEPCWNSLADSSYIFEEAEMQEPRTQIIRGVNSLSWHEAPEKLENPDKISIPAPAGFANRISKKDVFMSRGWGAGGLPFSVLYMNAHNSRQQNHGSTVNSVDSQKSGTQIRAAEMAPVSGKNIQQNYRVTLRNKPSNQTRRQYSIIPQLFISYGWGPRGN